MNIAFVVELARCVREIGLYAINYVDDEDQRYFDDGVTNTHMNAVVAKNDAQC